MVTIYHIIKTKSTITIPQLLLTLIKKKKKKKLKAQKEINFPHRSIYNNFNNIRIQNI